MQILVPIHGNVDLHAIEEVVQAARRTEVLNHCGQLVILLVTLGVRNASKFVICSETLSTFTVQAESSGIDPS